MNTYAHPEVSPVRRSRPAGSYLRYELLRTLRDRTFLIFALGFPLVLYFVIAGPNRDNKDFIGTGLSAPLYYMVGLASFATMTAMLSTGTRIAAERAAGWSRQLRITPLSSGAYVRTKVLTGYLMALLTMALLYASGTVLGVRLSPAEWLEMSLLILIALVPFAALGVLLGNLVRQESVGAVMGATTGLLALISGTWFPIGHGVLYEIVRFLPSYWLVQASHVPLGVSAWTPLGWAVVIAWSVVLSGLALRVYLRDPERQ